MREFKTPRGLRSRPVRFIGCFGWRPLLAALAPLSFPLSTFSTTSGVESIPMAPRFFYSSPLPSPLEGPSSRRGGRISKFCEIPNVKNSTSSSLVFVSRSKIYFSSGFLAYTLPSSYYYLFYVVCIILKSRKGVGKFFIIIYRYIIFFIIYRFNGKLDCYAIAPCLRRE